MPQLSRGMAMPFARLLLFVSALLAFVELQGQVNCGDPKFGAPVISNIEVIYPSDCSTETTASISVHAQVVGGGFGYEAYWRYSINGSPGQSSGFFSNLAPGTYQVEVRDIETGCSDSETIIINAITPYSVDISTSVSDPTSYCTSDGSITVNVSGAAPPYQYRINGGTWTSDNTFTGLDKGTYTIEVSTNNGACISGITETLNAVAPPLINQIIKTNATSCAPPNGRIEINASPGSDLWYSIDGGNTWRTNNVFDSLSPGNYTIAVRYGWDEECVRFHFPSTVTVNGPNPITISSVQPTAASSCSATNGAITINASGSSTLYYQVEGGQWQTSKTIAGLVAGSYNVYVRYANSACVTPYSGNPITVGPNDLRINSVNSTPPTTCSSTQGNGSITINAQNNGNPILYSINGGQTYSSNNIFTGLSAGTYNIRIANSDQSCSVAYTPVTLQEPSILTIQSVNLTQPTDCNILNGGIGITVSPSGSYQYSIDGGQSFQSASTFSNLGQGIYNIVVKTLGSECIANYASNPVSLQAVTCPEICNDGVDNDGNGQIDDCLDATCGLTPIQLVITQTNCQTNVKGSININISAAAKDCSTLKAGDILFTEYHAESFTSQVNTDRFSFVPLVNIAGGTQLIFTDKGWINSTSGFRSGEGVIQWTAPGGGVVAGTEITISITKYGSTVFTSATSGTVKKDSSIPNSQAYGSSLNFDLEPNGDQVIVLCGTSFATADLNNLVFISAINANGTSWNTGGATSSNTSAIPPGLVNGVTAQAIGNTNDWEGTAPGDNTIYYSINGGRTWHSGQIFNELDPGFYKVLVKRFNCITAYPNNPVQIFACEEICDDGIDNDGNGLADCNDPACGVASYSFSVVQPGCAPAPTVGRITITPSNSENYLYSINAGASWHGMPEFSNLDPGIYQIAVKRADTGCELFHAGGSVVFQSPTCYEICDDGVDNDDDGDVDCEDSDCGIAADFELDMTPPACPVGTANGAISINTTFSSGFKDCSNLQPGDIAITFYDADPDQFTFVPRVNIAAGTKIIFTDKGYKPAYTEDGVTFPATMRSAEGIAQWTAPTGGVVAGTAITVVRSPLSATAGSVLFDTAIPGYAAFDASSPNFSLSASGDQLIALCGTSFDLSQVTFLFAIHANGSNWDSDSNSDGTSAIPSGLVNGVTAIAVGDVSEATIPLAPISLATTYEYSIDGGQTFDTSGVFSNLAAGAYDILIRNQSTGCTAPYSDESIVLEVPDCPEICDNEIDDDGNGLADCDDPVCGVAPYTLQITQPTCPASVQSGDITFVPSDGKAYLYSIDGGNNIQSSPTFNQLAPGEYYIWIEAINSGCWGTRDTIVLIAPDCPEICNDDIDNDGDGLTDCADPDAPCYVAPYEVEIVQPLSVSNPASGKIHVLASDSKSYKFSIDSGYTKVDLPLFDNLEPGDYNVVVYTSHCAEPYENNPVPLRLPPPHGGAGEDKETCPGSPCVTIGTANPNQDYCYSWEPAEGLDEDERFSPNPCVNPSQTTTYRLHIIDENDDLIETDEVMVTVLTPPTVTISATEMVVCEGAHSILTANTKNKYVKYEWSTGEITQSIRVVSGDTYTVTVTGSNNCQAIASIEIKDAEDVEIELEPNPAVLCLGQALTLSAPEGFVEYQWSTMDGNIAAGQDSREVEVNAVGTYEVSVTHANGCTSTGSIEVISNGDPNAIQQKLVEEGFVCIPVTITTPPPGIKPDRPDLEKNTEYVDNQATGLQFHFQVTPGESLSSEQLETLLESMLAGNACGLLPKGLITSDNSFCNSTFFEQKKGDFSNSEVGIWMHFFDGEGDNDCMYVKGFGQEGQGGSLQTEYFSYFFEKLGQDSNNYGFDSSSEKLISFIVNEATTNYLDVIPSELITSNSSLPLYPTGDLELIRDRMPCLSDNPIVGIAPSGIPVWLPTGSTPRFGIKDAFKPLIDARTTSGFTIHVGDNRGVYRGYSCGNEFSGYRETVKGENYTFNVNNISQDISNAWIGEMYELPCPYSYYRTQDVIYDFSDFEFTNDATGELRKDISDYIIQVGDKHHYIWLCTAVITEESLNKPFQVELLRSSNGEFAGFEMYVYNVVGGVERIYAQPHPQNPRSFYYYRILCDGTLQWIPGFALWDDLSRNLKALSELPHVVLEVVGIYLDGADYLNAALYLVKGNIGEAGLTLALSPFGVNVIVKYVDGIAKFFVNIGDREAELIAFLIRYAEDGEEINIARAIEDIVEAADRAGITPSQLERYIPWLDKLVQTNPKLALKIIDDIELQTIWKYADEAGLDNAKLIQLFQDLDGTPGLIDAFKNNPGLVKAWGVLSSVDANDVTRLNLDYLINIDDYLTRSGRSVDELKDDITNFEDGLETFLDELGDTSSSGVWDLGPFQRGREIEIDLGANQSWPPNFPTIDAYDRSTGLVTSIKSIDLNASSYQDLNKLKNRLNGYLTKLEDFQDASFGGITVPEPGSSILTKELKIAIPQQPTAEQQLIFNELINTGSMANPQIIVSFIVYP